MVILSDYVIYGELFGGNIQSSRIGKIKTVILDICVVGSFLLLSLPTLGINSIIINYIIENTHYYIVLLGSICSIFEIFALLDYRKKNNISRENPSNIKIKDLNITKKTFKELIHDSFDTKYYLLHKNEPIMRQLYKVSEN